MTLRYWGSGQWLCDDSTKALVLKCVAIGGGGLKNVQKWRDVIYRRPLIPFIHNLKMLLIFISANYVNWNWTIHWNSQFTSETMVNQIYLFIAAYIFMLDITCDILTNIYDASISTIIFWIRKIWYNCFYFII